MPRKTRKIEPWNPRGDDMRTEEIERVHAAWLAHVKARHLFTLPDSASIASTLTGSHPVFKSRRRGAQS
jgi:hypothetical protein